MIAGQGWAFADSQYGYALLSVLGIAGAYLCFSERLGMSIMLMCIVLIPRCTSPSTLEYSRPLKISGQCQVVRTMYRGQETFSQLKCGTIDGLVRLKQTRYSDPFYPGQVMELDGWVRHFHPAHNPGEYDQKTMALNEGLKWSFKGNYKATINSPSPSIDERFKRWSRQTLDRGDRGYGRMALKGMLLGERHAVPSEDTRIFRATGTGHLLAVSGLHVGSLCWCVWWLVNLLGLRFKLIYPGRAATVIAILAIWVLVFLAQNPLSAKRAALMLSFALLARELGWKTELLRLLAIAAVFATILSPSAVLNIGFQFSFLTVFALAMVSKKNLEKNGSPVEYAMVASVASWVIECWHFGTITLSAPLCNLILIPIASLVIVPFGFLGILISPMSQHPLDLVALITEMFLGLAGGLGELFGPPTITGRHWSPVILALLISYLIRLTWLIKLLLGLSVVILWYGEKPKKTFIDFVYVGQGDATLLVSETSAALIDAGGESSAWRLVNHLSRIGVRRLDWVLITHHHPDHYGGLAELAKTIEIERIVHLPSDNPTSHWSQTRSRLQRIRSNRPENFEHLGQFVIQSILPTRNPHASENDRSIAVRVSAGLSSLMMTGDLEAFGERRLVAMGIPPSDALHLGHHGSRTSSTNLFLEAVSPKIAIASCGLENRYGFPHPLVSKRLETNNISVFTTAANGLIRLIPDQSGWTVSTLR